jgi:ethanolamine ammonia-lyase small subunit
MSDPRWTRTRTKAAARSAEGRANTRPERTGALLRALYPHGVAADDLEDLATTVPICAALARHVEQRGMTRSALLDVASEALAGHVAQQIDPNETIALVPTEASENE